MTSPSYVGGDAAPGGIWRWAALALFLIALAAAGLAVATAGAGGWSGVALLAGIGSIAGLFLAVIWPRANVAAADARRVAEAAAKANVAWAITSRDGVVIHSNEAYRRLAGAREREAPPPPELALPGESAAAVLYRLSRKARAGLSHEEILQAASGLELLVAVRPLSDGRAAWWFTPRVAAREAASTGTAAIAPGSASGLSGGAAMFRDAPIGIAIAEPDGTLVETNARFQQFFGAGGDLGGRALADLAAPPDRAEITETFVRASAGESAAFGLRAASGVESLAEIHMRRLPDSARLVLYLIDVSEQKALETKFAQSQKMQAVGQLAGGVAHDFNNLLTVIIGNSEFLLMRHPAGDPSFREVNEVHQNALRAATLVGQLLAFSRKQTMQPRVLALRDVIGELALMLRRLLREGVELKLEHGNDLWPVHADETQISNALINLVVNARDAMPKGGVVAITTANDCVSEATPLGSGVMPAGDYVRIDVRDSGVGIPKEHVGKIFDPFFTTKPVGQGTGLGLATVYGIVKQTGGFITVDSEVGKGTVFRIYLPRYKGDSLQIAEPERAPPRDITGQDTILLVEDEEAVRSFAARALKLRGYRVLEAAGGEEALELVSRHEGAIHLLITDVVMPNMDGPTLVRALKRLRPDMAVIFMSGYAEEAFRRHDENAAELHFLAKPFGLKQLAAKVKDVLSSAPAATKAD
ncbi:MAG TPA: ATP-binding protein [Rhizomicrobium sp.]|nr:ATP-binding protein [Rhizomicrobium sp.]